MMRQNSYILGVDVGGTHIRIGLVDDQAKITAPVKVEQKNVLGKDPVNSLIGFIQSYLRENAPDRPVAAMAMGLPATMDRDRATVYNAPNLDGFDGVPIKAILRESLPFPIFLERDVTMLFYYDLYDHRLPQDGVLIGCYIGTGLGNVISIDGKLLVGNDGVACELGHIPMWDQTERCTCGNPGCAEVFTAGKYLDGLQSRFYPETPMNRLFLEKGEEPLLHEYIAHLSIPIATEINLINPGAVILGGGVLSMDGFPLKRLEEHIYRHVRKPVIGGKITFIYSHDTGENGIIGCALFARRQLARQET